jgi:hypothetical protein
MQSMYVIPILLGNMQHDATIQNDGKMLDGVFIYLIEVTFTILFTYSIKIKYHISLAEIRSGNLYSSPNIIRMKSRMEWAGIVARVVRIRKHAGIWWESQKERVH